VYVVNLAVAPPGQTRATAVDLVVGTRLAWAHVREVTFRSRLPGFAAWLGEQLPGVDPTTLTEQVRTEMAERYWQLSTTRFGVSRPIDPLLRLYVEMGCQPIELVDHRGSLCDVVSCRL
jgi:hypothetical protein